MFPAPLVRWSWSSLVWSSSLVPHRGFLPWWLVAECGYHFPGALVYHVSLLKSFLTVSLLLVHPLLSLTAVFFLYDLSPIAVTISEARRNFFHFLTRLCAVLGGTFALSGGIASRNEYLFVLEYHIATLILLKGNEPAPAISTVQIRVSATFLL